MVTHVPPSPSLSSASLSTLTGSLPSQGRRSTSRVPSQPRSSTSSRRAPSSYRPPVMAYPPTSYPPSPPSSSHTYTSSPPSSYTAPRLPETHARSHHAPSRAAPSVAASRATEAARHSRHRSRGTGQPEYSRRAETRASSVASSLTGEDYDNQRNEFPWFGESGDVEIALNSRSGKIERSYKLHNLILRQNSKWWDQALRDAPSSDNQQASEQVQVQTPRPSDSRNARTKPAFAARSSRRRTERAGATAPDVHDDDLTKTCWHFALDWSNSNSDGYPMLVLQTHTHPTAPSEGPPRRSRPSTPSRSFFRSLTSRRSSRHSRHSSASSTTSHPNQSATTIVPSPELSEEDADALAAYASLFSVMYNHHPTLDATSLPDAYVQSKTLLRLAERYEALDVTRPRVEHHLLHFNRTLYANIARYPPSYLKLGHLLQSRAIFGEALIHVVGQWPVHEKHLNDISERTRDLIADKHEELAEARNKVDARLFRVSLTARGGEKVGPGQFLDWMALCLFRDWLANQAPLPPKSGILKSSSSSGGRQDGDRRKPDPAVPGRAYRLMAQGGEAYLPRNQLKSFLKYQAPEVLSSRESLKRLERRMDEIKATARDSVRGLCRSFLEGSEDVSYLTCTRLEERDWEWVWNER